MSLFTKATNQQAYAKFGLLGFPGSGKTYTAALIARGIARMSDPPAKVLMVDTESGSDFILPLLEDVGVELYTLKSRSFSDLLNSVAEAEEMGAVLIIDSITHIWVAFQNDYKTKKGIKRLSFHHWGEIKPAWGQFTDRYLTAKCHIILCGRAGFEYDYHEDEDGNLELKKTGTKMKAETEMGYEPSFLVEMELVKSGELKRGERNAVHRAHILKDRTSLMDGQFFDDPTFDTFLPIFSRLNLGGEHMVLDTSRTSEDMFDESGDTNWKAKKRMRTIALEKIENTLKSYFGTSKDDRKNMRALLKDTFGTDSWTDISERVPLEKLEELTTVDPEAPHGDHPFEVVAKEKVNGSRS